MALLPDLPAGTVFQWPTMPDREWVVDPATMISEPDCLPVYVTRWADGTTPAPPAAPVPVDGERERVDADLAVRLHGVNLRESADRLRSQGHPHLADSIESAMFMLTLAAAAPSTRQDPHDQALAHLAALSELLVTMQVPDPRGPLAIGVMYERTHHAVRESIEYHRRAMAEGFGSITASAPSTSDPEPTATLGQRGDLPHINCSLYAHRADTNHDPHVHPFEHIGIVVDAWCQGRPAPTAPVDPEALNAGETS